jgi:hypothetical protein
LITEIIFGEECRSWSTSLCDFQQAPLTSSPSACVPTQCDRLCFTPIWNTRQTYNSGVCTLVWLKRI